jgi:hypothetical protein
MRERREEEEEAETERGIKTLKKTTLHLLACFEEALEMGVELFRSDYILGRKWRRR